MESKQGLHPSVQQFKQFMKEHPLLMNEVKGEGKSLQELFEEWSVLGSEHEQWQAYRRLESTTAAAPQGSQQEEKSSQSATDTLGQIMTMIKRMNVQDLQNHLAQFSSVLSNVQNVIQSFQQPNNQPNRGPHDHPFSFRRD